MSRSPQKKIRFYRLCYSVNGRTLAIQDSWPWAETMRRNYPRSVLRCDDLTFTPRVHHLETNDGASVEMPYLGIHRPIDTSLMTRADGEDFVDIEDGEADPWRHSSVVFFTNKKNVVAIIQGTQSSAGVKSILPFLKSTLRVPDGHHLDIKPFVAADDVARLDAAGGVSRYDAKVRTEQSLLFPGVDEGDGVYGMARQLASQLGDLEVTISLRMPKGGDTSEHRRRLQAFVQSDAHAIREHQQRAAELGHKGFWSRATVPGEDGSEVLHLIEEHLTKTVIVPATLASNGGHRLRFSDLVKAAAHEVHLWESSPT